MQVDRHVSRIAEPAPFLLLLSREAFPLVSTFCFNDTKSTPTDLHSSAMDCLIQQTAFADHAPTLRFLLLARTSACRSAHALPPAA